MFELIAVMKFGVVGGAIFPHFVDDLEPAISQAAQGTGVTLVFLAMVLIINFSPDTAS